MTPEERKVGEEFLEAAGLKKKERDAARVVWAAYVDGPTVEAICAATGLTRAFVEPIYQRMTDQGIWRDGKICMESNNSDERFIELVLHVLAATGQACVKYPTRPVPPAGVPDWRTL